MSSVLSERAWVVREQVVFISGACSFYVWKGASCFIKANVMINAIEGQQ